MMLLQNQTQLLENIVRATISSTLGCNVTIEGHLILQDPVTAQRHSLFFRDDEPTRPHSNTSSIGFSTPSKLSSSSGSSGETSPASNASGSSGYGVNVHHRRKAVQPIRVTPQEIPLNLSVRSQTQGVHSPNAMAHLGYSSPQEPNRELFPPQLFHPASFLQYYMPNTSIPSQMTNINSPQISPNSLATQISTDTKPFPVFGTSDSKSKLSSASPTPGGKPPRKRRALGSSATATPATPGKARKFSCNQCHNLFPSLASLSDHTMNVHGTYRCSMCPTEFTQRSNLQRHALKHVGFKPFECKVCGRAYYRKDHLARHVEQTHPGVEPRVGIQVNLSASESLTYLERMMDASSDDQTKANVGEVLESLNLGGLSSDDLDEATVAGLEPGTVVVRPEHPSDINDADIDVVH